MLLEIHPNNPNPRHIATVVDCLKSGGIIAYPTDTIYGLGCDIFQPKAIEKIAQIKGVDPAKAQLSFVCADLSDLSQYTKSISTPLYRLLKNYLPGPFTFILPASKQVPKLLQNKKNTIGLRIPDNNIASAIVSALEHPILSASLPGEMVDSLLPCLNSIPLLILAKFFNTLSVSLDSFILFPHHKKVYLLNTLYHVRTKTSSST
jgi:tRNA threonylcarbamoyl adenosine modification protein (Sua5/YciO/YrdC/YwlC family)